MIVVRADPVICGHSGEARNLAEVALTRLARHVVVFAMIELESHRAESFQAFERSIARHDEVTACWALGGGFDYLLQVVARDIDDYQRLIDALLAERAGVQRYFTYIVTKDVKSAPPPFGRLRMDPPKE